MVSNSGLRPLGLRPAFGEHAWPLSRLASAAFCLSLALTVSLLRPADLRAQSSGNSQQGAADTNPGEAQAPANPSTTSDDPQSAGTQNPPASPGAGQTTATQKPAAKAAPSAQELANQVNNPAAPVTFIQFRDILAPNVPGANGATNSLQMQPVLPIGPFKAFPFVQLVKMTMPLYVAVPGSVDPALQQFGANGIGDLQFFDLVTIKQSWGRWGVGPTLVFPTATGNALGAGKWQAGPSVALIYTGIKNLTAGLIVQNPISYAGSPNRPSVNQMIITPTFTFNLKEGWFVGLSDYNFSFNWENGGAGTVPLGVQFGKVVTLGKQPFAMSFEAGGTAVRPAGTVNPGWIFGFEISPIFNFHIGPGEVVKARKQN